MSAIEPNKSEVKIGIDTPKTYRLVGKSSQLKQRKAVEFPGDVIVL